VAVVISTEQSAGDRKVLASNAKDGARRMLFSPEEITILTEDTEASLLARFRLWATLCHLLDATCKYPLAKCPETSSIERILELVQVRHDALYFNTLPFIKRPSPTPSYSRYMCIHLRTHSIRQGFV
jgi:hypothetical protein